MDNLICKEIIDSLKSFKLHPIVLASKFAIAWVWCFLNFHSGESKLFIFMDAWLMTPL